MNFVKQVEAGRLARAVRSDQRMDGAAPNPQVHPAHRDEAGELLGEVLGLEDEIVTHDATGPIIAFSGEVGFRFAA